jgi:hypothetical protein
MSTRTQVAYRFRGGGPYPYDGTLKELRAYIARAWEFGNDPADYQAVTREVTTTATEWVTAS